MSRSEEVREREVRATLWRIIIRRLVTLTMLAVAMEWATPVVSSDILLAPPACTTANDPCYDVRDATPHAPSEGSGRTSSTSCTSM
jgi:hypothetical protein